jgi:hypothetical protein
MPRQNIGRHSIACPEHSDRTLRLGDLNTSDRWGTSQQELGPTCASADLDQAKSTKTVAKLRRANTMSIFLALAI